MGTPDTLTTGTGATFTQAFDAFGAPDPDNAELTQWVHGPRSADPVVQAPHWSQGMNRYAYVFNDPVNATDPSGFAAAGLDGYAGPAHLAGTTGVPGMFTSDAAPGARGSAIVLSLPPLSSTN